MPTGLVQTRQMFAVNAAEFHKTMCLQRGLEQCQTRKQTALDQGSRTDRVTVFANPILTLDLDI